MKIMIHEWGLDNAGVLPFGEFVKANLKLGENLEAVLPRLTEEYNKSVVNSNANNDFALFERAMGTNARECKEIIQYLVAKDTTELAAVVYSLSYKYKDLKLLFELDLLIRGVYDLIESQTQDIEDLYHSKYRWFVRALYAAVKVTHANGYYDKMLDYCSLASVVNPGDNLGFRYYVMEQLCGRISYQDFNNAFPLNDDYSTKVFHACCLLSNGYEERGSALLEQFNKDELNILIGIKKVAKNQVYDLILSGFEKNSIDDVRMIKDKHKLINQHLIGSELVFNMLEM